MSQPNENDGNQMEVVEPVQNQVAVAGAIAQNGQPQPDVFKLDTDCWDEVFDCLSLKDVHSFGQTCKAFQRVTGEYFQWKYEAVSVRCVGNEGYVGNDRVDEFIKYAKKIRFDWMLPPAGTNYDSAKQVTLVQINLDALEINSMNFLSKVEHLHLWACKLDENILRALIESCVNLKRLKLFANSRLAWPIHNHHATIEHLRLDDYKSFVNSQLVDFLENNPNIRSLQINSTSLQFNRDLLLNANIKLDDLAIHFFGNYDDDIHGLLADLHARGFYKRLHLKSYETLPIAQLHVLEGLTTLYFARTDVYKWRPLVNLRELGIDFHWNASRNKGVNSVALTDHLPSLQHLFIARANFEELLPFFRRSIHLKYVEIHEFEAKVLNIRALNEERKKLPGACKVTIFVDEDVYLATKWTKAGTTAELIEIKRKESHDVVRPHDFWTFYRKLH